MAISAPVADRNGLRRIPSIIAKSFSLQARVPSQLDHSTDELFRGQARSTAIAKGTACNSLTPSAHR